MKNLAKIGAGLIGAVTVIGLALPAFAMENGGAGDSKDSATGVKHARSSTSQAFDATKVGCVGTAVSKREDAIDAAFSAFTASESAALSARKSGLASAYSSATDMSSLKLSIKDAWKAFRDAKATARKTFWDARNSAWTSFKSDAKACGAPAMEGPEASNEISK